MTAVKFQVNFLRGLDLVTILYRVSFTIRKKKKLTDVRLSKLLGGWKGVLQKAAKPIFAASVGSRSRNFLAQARFERVVPFPGPVFFFFFG